MFQIGVDEAGKGPVLGPMVAAAVRGEPADFPDGIVDSKQLSAAKRESLAAELRRSGSVDVGVGIVSVDEIDDPTTDMNRLTVAGQVRALVEIAQAGDAVIVDAGDVSESRFGRRVREGAASAGVEIEITAEHKADDSHQQVAAASIIAKVERDKQMATIGENYNEVGPVGSGYPSDQTTRDFLRTYFDHYGEIPPCARESWSTCEDLLAAAQQASLDDF